VANASSARALHLDGTARRQLTRQRVGARLPPLELRRREQAAVGDARTGVAQVDDRGDLGLELGAECGEQLSERGVETRLGNTRARCVDVA